MRTSLFILLSVLALSACSNTVQPGTIGVPVNWGQVEPFSYPEGFHWISPFTDVHPMSIQTQTYTMSGGGSDGNSDSSVNVLTQDQLSVVVDISVQFHLNPGHANSVYRLFGEQYDQNIVHPLVRTAVRDAASEFTAVQLVDQRARLQGRMETLMRTSLVSTLHGRHIDDQAIEIDNILLRNIDLPDSLDQAIAAVQQQQQQTAQREQALHTAQAEADRLRVEAEGMRVAAVTRAQGEAEANRLVAASLTPDVLRLRQIEATSQLLQNTNTRMVIVPAGSGTTLMLAPPSSLTATAGGN